MCFIGHASVHNTVLFCTLRLTELVIIFILAVLFLEFWKRRQYYLQYDWDVLGYEDTEVPIYTFIS